MEEIGSIQRVASLASDGHGSPNPNFQEREGFEVDFLAIDKRLRNIRMSIQLSEKLVNSNQSKVLKETWQAERFRVHQSNHFDGFDVVTP